MKDDRDRRLEGGQRRRVPQLFEWHLDVVDHAGMGFDETHRTRAVRQPQARRLAIGIEILHGVSLPTREMLT